MNKDRLYDRIESAVLSMYSASDNNGSWTMPDGQNAMILSPTGHLTFVHNKSLREWSSTMKDVADVMRERNIVINALGHAMMKAHDEITAGKFVVAANRLALALSLVVPSQRAMSQLDVSDGQMDQPDGLTILDADDVDAEAIAANEWRVWASDNATGQRMCFDWDLSTERKIALSWKVDTDDARYAAARQRAILRRRSR